jgi:predicted  nucleic acid-binding Zn-ribbon protein
MEEPSVAAPLEVLLDLQAHDTRLDQLRHQRETLPPRARISALEAELAGLAATSAEVQGARDDVAREQKRIEDEVATIEAKAAEVNGTLYGGTVTSPRALQDLQADLESLQRRQRQLEDMVIEQMEAAEPLDERLAVLQADQSARAAELEEARRDLTAQEAEVDVQVDAVQGERDGLVAGVDPALLTEYETLRRQFGGVGVARLEGGRCLGCQLQLSAVERDRIKGLDPGALVHCEECGRLLVR